MTDHIAVAYTTHRTLLVSLAARICGPSHAEDAVQLAVLRAYREGYDDARGDARAWLTTITINCARDVLRRERRRGLGRTDELSDDHIRADHRDETERVSELRRALATAERVLPSRERDALVIVALCGTEETAAVLGVSRGNAKVIAHRARLTLRAHL